jgi:murein DD-endopeptidase MepM/ murein hydrolase activator NlpD
MNWSLKTFQIGARLLLTFSLLAAAQPLPAWAQAAGPIYVVQEGETLFSIARQFGIALADLQAANPTINADRLQIGQPLVIPGFGDAAATLSAHLLEPGESLDSLSLRFGLKRETLIRLNRIVNPDLLYINQAIVLTDQADGGAPLAAGLAASARAGEGWVAFAAARNQNAWALAALNRHEHPGGLLPGAIVALPGGEAPIKALPAPLRDVQLRSLPIEQGTTLSIEILSTQAVQLSGALGEWPLNFVSDAAQPKTYYALLGINRLADPNLYPLSVTVVDEAGQRARFAQSLPVRSGGYGQDPPLSVDPATVDPAVVAPETEQVKAIVAPVTPTRYWSGLFARPSPGALRSYFGALRSYNGSPYDSFHTGVDFSGGVDTPITAPAPGVVVFAGLLTVRGNATLIDHGWGVYSGFWHQSSIAVQVGERVDTGQIIGQQGATGRVTGPHLHWEMWVGGYQVDPLQWLETDFP